LLRNLAEGNRFAQVIAGKGAETVDEGQRLNRFGAIHESSAFFLPFSAQWPLLRAPAVGQDGCFDPSRSVSRRSFERIAVTREQQLHFKAVRMLAFTTIFWSLSFPLVKAIGILQTQIVPGSSSWFHAGLTAFVRFTLAALILLPFLRRTSRPASDQKARPFMTRSELWQGLGLGLFGGGGILLQMDGLGHTDASTSAFVTQAYCILVPIIVAFRDRRAPAARVILATAIMLAGIAVLSRFNPRTFHLGRGEAETLISAIFFAGQILWLERPKFHGNDPLRFSVVMFLVMAGLSAPIVAATWKSPADVLACYSNPAVLAIAAAITLFCTVGAFVAMNKYQPFVPATEAAIIYGTEPVWASILALFLPAWLSAWTAINYPNETLTLQLLIGGTLVLAANLILQWKWAKN
jgi:drug/metabolite transporter (DMT)-like permease